MSTPYSKRKRRSTKPHTPGSVYGIRNKRRRSENEDDSISYTFLPERLYFSADVSDEVEDELQDLTGETWTVFRVSPMHNFEYSRIRLKQYSRKMKENLTVNLPQAKMELHYDVNFSVAEGISATEHDNEAVRITVNAKRQMNSRNTDTRTYYLGFLVCRGAPATMQENSSVHLPVLLCKGRVGIINSVHNILQKFFECVIVPFTLTQEDLTWICALQSEEVARGRQAAVMEMVFTAPRLSVKNVINFKLPLASLKILWKCIHDSNLDYASFEEVKKFYDFLLEQISTMSSINVACCQLIKIKTPTLMVTNETKFRATSEKVVRLILSFLYDGTTLINSCIPTLGMQPD